MPGGHSNQEKSITYVVCKVLCRYKNVGLGFLNFGQNFRFRTNKKSNLSEMLGFFFGGGDLFTRNTTLKARVITRLLKFSPGYHKTIQIFLGQLIRNSPTHHVITSTNNRNYPRARNFRVTLGID